MAKICSQYALLPAACFRSKSRASQEGICTPLYPRPAAHLATESRLLNGGTEPANWARKIAGPLIVFIALFYCGRPLLATLTLKVTEPIFRPLSFGVPGERLPCALL